jgi:hypothetical protein
MKKQVKKLMLTKETLQDLGANLEHAAGGLMMEPPLTTGTGTCSVYDCIP